MASLALIEERAREDTPDLIPHIKLILTAIKDYPRGTDIGLPSHIIPVLEDYCDRRKIPFYHVAEDCVSVASTYWYLLDHENSR